MVNLLLAGNRGTTHSAYESAWLSWTSWCVERETNPLSNDLIPILEYLTALHLSGKSYSTINLHRSMLSSTLDPINGLAIGQNPLIIRLLKGIYNENPPVPRYKTMWDPEIVLNYMKISGDNELLSFPSLSRKLVTILALSTYLRTSELASIDTNSVVISSTSASFTLSKPRKAQFNGALKTFSLKVYPDKRVCPVACLGFYVLVTDYLRTENNGNNLFIGLNAPHLAVTANTIGRWIKKYLGDSGIDTSVFSAHSTRGAAASKAAESGDSISSILSAGGWTRESTFARFYQRPLVSPNPARV